MEGEGEATGENDNSTQVHHLGENARIHVNDEYAGFWNDWIQIDMYFPAEASQIFVIWYL